MGFENLQSYSVSSSLFCFLVCGHNVISQLPVLTACCHALPTITYSDLWDFNSEEIFFIKLFVVMVFHHSNRKVTNTAIHEDQFLEPKVLYYPQSHMGCLTSAVNTDPGLQKGFCDGQDRIWPGETWERRSRS